MSALILVNRLLDIKKKTKKNTLVIRLTCAIYNCKGGVVLHRYGFICSLFLRIPLTRYGSSVSRLHTVCTRRSVWSCVRPASAPGPAPRRTARKNSLTSCMLEITVYVHVCSILFLFIFLPVLFLSICWCLYSFVLQVSHKLFHNVKWPPSPQIATCNCKACDC